MISGFLLISTTCFARIFNLFANTGGISKYLQISFFLKIHEIIKYIKFVCRNWRIKLKLKSLERVEVDCQQSFILSREHLGDLCCVRSRPIYTSSLSLSLSLFPFLSALALNLTVFQSREERAWRYLDARSRSNRTLIIDRPLAWNSQLTC